MEPSDCDTCVAGMYSQGGQTTCTMCSAGRYSQKSGASSELYCLSCPGGTHGPTLGASSVELCLDCQAGTFGAAGSSSCEICYAGTYSGDAAESCTSCQPGHFANDSQTEVCSTCVEGTYRDSTTNGSACVFCGAGTYSTTDGATSQDTCSRCPLGTYSADQGATSCSACEAGYYSSGSGLSKCSQCSSQDTPAGALGCCPVHNTAQWPISPSGSVHTAPGKSDIEVYELDVCSTKLLSASTMLSPSYASEASIVYLYSESLIATVSENEIQDCVTVSCPSDHCFVSVSATQSILGPGDKITATATVRTYTDGTFTDGMYFLSTCPNVATIVVTGFGCASYTLRTFVWTLLSVVFFTVFMGLLLEAYQRSRSKSYALCSVAMHMRRESTRVLPTTEMLWETFRSGLGLVAEELPRKRFITGVTPGLPDSAQTLEVEFCVQPLSDHDQLKKRLRQIQWVPSGELRQWRGVRVEPQFVTIVKVVGRTPGMDFVDVLERVILWCTGGRQDEPAPETLDDLHADVASELLSQLVTRQGLAFIFAQYALNLSLTVFLPLWAYKSMDDCEDGFPWEIHVIWVMYLVLTCCLSLYLLRRFGGPMAGAFLWRFRARLLLRCAFTGFLLTDTYQDITFPVIARTCSFDLWFVSAWLVVLGVGVMQVGVHLMGLLLKYRRYRLARTPEELERILIDSIFLLLRGSDNFPLVYAVRPAMEERLGGSSSWAMKTSEARVAFFRFLFEDVEQSALQLVFLAFYPTATGDQIWVSLSLATSLFLSFTLVVQCLPQVRDWVWYRVLSRPVLLPPVVRSIWLLVLLLAYRAISAFPWITACSPGGDPCTGVGSSNFLFGCSDGELRFFGLSAREQVVDDVIEVCLFSFFAFAAVVLMVALFWLAQQEGQRRRNERSVSVEEYDAGRRLAPATGTLRPWLDQDDDCWLTAAQVVHGAATAAGEVDLAKLVQAIDRSTFKLARGQQGLLSAGWNWRSLPSLLTELKKSKVVQSMSSEVRRNAADLTIDSDKMIKLADVQKRVRRLLRDRGFHNLSLFDKSEAIAAATGQVAPIKLVHFSSIEKLGELPSYDSAEAMDVSELRTLVGTRMGVPAETVDHFIVPFFVSHRWLHTTGPRSGHRPDTEDNIKARGLVAFAQWFMKSAISAGISCEVAFWIDWCCCDQDPVRMEVAISALPLYIAACMKVVVWRTSDFEVRCWTMVERLMTYSFCAGGLMPYVISEAFVRYPQEATMSPSSPVADAASSSTPTHRKSEKPKDVWQVLIGVKWVDFDTKAQHSLQAARDRGDGKVQLNINGVEYEVNLRTGVQRNMVTGTEREIREVKMDAELLPGLDLDSERPAVAPGGDDSPKAAEDTTELLPTGGAGGPEAAAVPDSAADARSADEHVATTGAGDTSGDFSAVVIGKPSQPPASTGESASCSTPGPVDGSRPRRRSIVVDFTVHRRARKLPNPLDMDVCQVTRSSDRRAIQHLVDLALTVPAIEVFADRQRVEWGLTEVVEQSPMARLELPKECKEPPKLWLVPTEAARDWRLVVRHIDEMHDGSRPAEDADAFLWVDHGARPPMAPPTPSELDRCFEDVDSAVAEEGDVNGTLRALILALKGDLHAAITSRNVTAMEAAVMRTRGVALPDKQLAVERIVSRRLEAALESGEEAQLRHELMVARQSGAGHIEMAQRAKREQQRLYKKQLSGRLRQQLDEQFKEPRDTIDVACLAAVHQVATAHDIVDIVHDTDACVEAHMQKLREASKVEALRSIQEAAEQSEWSEIAERAGRLAEITNLEGALRRAAAKRNLSAIRGVEERANRKGLTEVVLKARSVIKETVGHLGEEMGLPASWDIEELVSQETKRRVRKQEETDKALLERMQTLVNETYWGWGGLGKQTRTRDRKSEKIPDHLEVTSVVHVQNAESYVNYNAKRAAIAAKLVGSPIKTDWDVKTSKVSLEDVGRHGTKLNGDINEVYLWHGTSPKGALNITDTDFDLKLSGSAYGSLFGAGVYFAESCMKADEYTISDKRGWRPFILCRVVLGRIHYCDAYDPTKSSKTLEQSCTVGGYDSVLGDREKVRMTFREFVVFDGHQIYPEYIVWYQRK